MLDFSDIQGNILQGYRSFHTARFLYFRIDTIQGGTELISALVSSRTGAAMITPAQWPKRPEVATNMGVSMAGLRALGLEPEVLAGFPPEFQVGMRGRAPLLGDFGASDPGNWDDPWRTDHVHIVLMCYSDCPNKLDAHCRRLRGLVRQGVSELEPAQDAAVLKVGNVRKRIEHFGFLDGVSNPDIEEVPDDGKHTDTGNVDKDGKFRKVRIGEFLLGHRGEGEEVAPMPRPPLLAYNGTFLVLRKLEQDVAGFRDFVRGKARLLRSVLGQALPSGANPEDYLAAKMMGRWYDGSPLDVYPDGGKDDPTNQFTFADDETGSRCPLGAHVRRVNPRGSLGFEGKIVSRRRLIRRGISYGEYLPEQSEPTGEPRATLGRGIMFLAFNASIERQFEFVQKQWLNNGDELGQGDDSDPIAGARYGDGHMVDPGTVFRRTAAGTGRMVIPGDDGICRPPFLCSEIPRFVTMRGGEYFFVPSLTGLRLLASGEVNAS